jgi:H+/Cl- antiporter ClcA
VTELPDDVGRFLHQVIDSIEQLEVLLLARISAGRSWTAEDMARELVLSLLIGAPVGLVVVAFILLTGRLASYMYPPGGAGWRRLAVPTLGALVSGILLARYFPDAQGSGIPQTKAALFIYDGRITFRTVVGKFVCCCTALASGIALSARPTESDQALDLVLAKLAD